MYPYENARLRKQAAHKASATAKQMHAATGLTVLALLPVPLALCPRASFLVYANSV